MNKDFNKHLNELLSDINLPTEEQIKADTKAEKVSLALKGYKHSNETKKKYSQSHKGRKLSKEHIEKSRLTQIKTKWEQTLNRLSKEDIINAQNKHGNHQSNTMNELGISFYPYKKLCKHYGIELKKSNYEKTEYARTKQSEPIFVWKCSKTQPFRKVGKPKKFYSVTECCRVLELHKGNMLRNMRNGTPYRNMFFEK